jgi:hypothetical protein
MNGRVLKVVKTIGMGVIVDDHGKKFRFRTSDVLNAHLTPDDQDVDFVLDGRCAKSIVILDGSPWTAFGPLISAPSHAHI